MDSTFSFGLFQPSYIMTIPVIVFVAFAALFIPSMMVPSAKPEAVGKAIACYLMKSFGLLLIAVSLLPLLYNTLASRTMLPVSSMSGLLLVFLCGLGIMTHFSRVVMTVDESSSVIPRLVFSHGFEVLGLMISLLSALSLMLSFLLTQSVSGWQMPATSLVLGLLLTLMFSVHITAKNARRKKR